MVNKKVCAVIVTFNRKVLLTRTLDSLLQQTVALERILIIDNASTDGTYEYLHNKNYLNDNIISYHSLSENTGGAGGFYSGMKIAYDANYDLIWLMDDDGYPEEKECLEHLLIASKSFDVLGPLVLDDKKNNLTSFPFGVRAHKGIVNDKNQALEISNITNEFNYILDALCPFNGILITRDVIEKVGFPDSRLFIWGDEINYLMRCENLRFRIATITSCTFLHPRAPNNSIKTLFGRYFNDAPTPLKLYCYCRNHVYNVKNLRGKKYVLTFSIKVIWFYLFTRPSLKKLFLAVKAIKDGYSEDFSQHEKLLGKSFN